jgi:hypothetical protein
MDTIDLDRARAFWFQRQGLASPAGAKADLAEVVARTGWIRTLGGADVYLAARARVTGLGRAAMDAAVEAGALRVIPAVRSCIYLVPGAEARWVLRVAEEAWRPRAEREVVKAGATWREVEQLADAAARVLQRNKLGTDAIRRALPDGAVRSLGEAGKKLGMSSLLPTALRMLELDDRIERTLEGGRLDTERYTWRLTLTLPRPGAVLMDGAARRARLAEIFFGQAGPATIPHFAAWAGWSQKDARAAAAGADLAPVAVRGLADDALVLARDLDALRDAKPAPGAVALTSFEDNYLTFHGGPAIVTAPEHRQIALKPWGVERPQRIADASHIASRTVVAGGLVCALWELDEANRRGVWAPLAPGAVAPAHAAKIDALVADAARFLLDELGHAKSFTLDTAEAVAARAADITTMRAAAARPTKARAKAPVKAPAKASRATAPRSARAPRASPARRGSTSRARPKTRARR